MDTDAKKVILAVDDTPENLDVVKNILAAEYVVKAAPNGEIALKIVQKQAPDIILLDIMMPGMDGYTVCQKLKESEHTRDIPVIFLTAKSSDEDEARGLALGAVDYITKPISPSVLEARVHTHLALLEARRSLAEKNEALLKAAKMQQDVESIMRHDLKSPLNVMVGVPQVLLMDDNLTEKQRNLIGNIEISGRKMSDMIDMSMSLLKMEYGTYEPQRTDVDIIALLQEVISEQERLLGLKRADLSVTVDERPLNESADLHIHSEKKLLSSLLSNLLKNAVEAVPVEGEILISVCSADSLMMTINNDGEVPLAIRDTFFDKFVTAEKNSGTGLGTYSARLITETLGGTITLDTSQVGRTTLTVSLPL